MKDQSGSQLPKKMDNYSLTVHNNFEAMKHLKKPLEKRDDLGKHKAKSESL